MTNLLNVLACQVGDQKIDADNLAGAIHMIILIIQVAIPVMVVVFGMLDLGKAVMAQKEDEIKKNQGLLVKRIIVAVLIFFVVTIVRLVVGFVADAADSDDITGCFDYFVNGPKSSSRR